MSDWITEKKVGHFFCLCLSFLCVSSLRLFVKLGKSPRYLCLSLFSSLSWSPTHLLISIPCLFLSTLTPLRLVFFSAEGKRAVSTATVLCSIHARLFSAFSACPRGLQTDCVIPSVPPGSLMWIKLWVAPTKWRNSKEQSDLYGHWCLSSFIFCNHCSKDWLFPFFDAVAESWTAKGHGLWKWWKWIVGFGEFDISLYLFWSLYLVLENISH